jgi:integrase
MKLTKRAIDSFKYQGDGQSRDARWDAAMPGFGVRIYPSGRKAFVLSYRNGGGKKRLVVLGTYGRDLTLEQAREKAIKQSGKVLDGADPVKERRKEREKERVGDRLKDAVETYLAGPVNFTTHKKKRRRRDGTVAEYKRVLTNELMPRWGRKRMEEISRADVIALLEAITERGGPIMANRILVEVRVFFDWYARTTGTLTANPAADVEATGVEITRDRTLSNDELKLVWTAADKLEWPVAPYVKLLILTAQRRGEIIGMRWADLDLDGAEPLWTLPRELTKANRLHTVPLSPQAVNIIRGLPRVEGPFVFSTGKGKDNKPRPINNFSGDKRALDREIAKTAEDAGTDIPAPWTLHDLRRSAATGMAGLNVTPHILSRILNHSLGKSEGTTSVYNRFEYLEKKRHALNTWAAHVERIIAGKPSGNVVALQHTA